ncbi:hypothetical protein C8T65DRAFT_834153 [Cerioporus squamosus]|nr:hypothetical protein C8T65DRAFT_834153 [Cerioporus squamosus]
MSTKKDKDTFLNVSSRTQLNLRGLLAEKQEVVARNKAAGQNSLKGGVVRTDKKPPKWMKPNPGVKDRAARDVELEEVPRAVLEEGSAILAKKARTYKKLKQGKSGGLSDKQLENLLVDIELKEINYESDSDDADESLTVPVRPQDEDDDPIMEYEDEFGRTCSARRSEIPRHLLPKPEEEREEDFDPYRIVDPVNYFPMYVPTEERKQQIDAQRAEEDTPLETHYDPTREVRDLGSANYKFSKNEDVRKQQQRELKERAEEAARNRELLQAPNVRAGAVEGMQGGPESAKTRAAEKRKRLLEERNKQLEARRKKRKAGEDTPPAQDIPTAGPSNVPQPTATPAQDDPFAAVEARTHKKSNQAVKQEIDAADDFLAKLEQDVLLKQRAQ